MPRVYRRGGGSGRSAARQSKRYASASSSSSYVADAGRAVRNERVPLVWRLCAFVAALSMPFAMGLVQTAMSFSPMSRQLQTILAILGAAVLLIASPRAVTAAAAQQPQQEKKKACVLTGGELVQHGWGGKDTGNNSCNSCSCDDGRVR